MLGDVIMRQRANLGEFIYYLIRKSCGGGIFCDIMVMQTIGNLCISNFSIKGLSSGMAS